MATLTPLSPRSLSTPKRGHDESVLHWGAAVGALVLASATVVSAITFSLQTSGALDDWLGQDVAWDALDRLTAAAELATAAAAVVTAVFVLADIAPARALTWAALAVAVLAWLSLTPLWWEVAGQYPPFDVPFFAALLVPVWLILLGADTWGARAWHAWLGAVTVLAGVAAVVALYLGFWGVVPVTVWAVLFAVAQLAGPHPASGARPTGDAASAASASTPGHDTGTTAEPGRWHRAPTGVVRLLRGVGPAVAVAVTFLVGWQIVSEWPETPSGDTSFAWMPAAVIMVCGVVALVGLAGLAVRTARAAVACATGFWLSTAWLYPAAFVGDGFPQSATGMMVGLSLLSLLPTAAVWAWAAFADDQPTAPVAGPRSPAGPGRRP